MVNLMCSTHRQGWVRLWFHHEMLWRCYLHKGCLTRWYGYAFFQYWQRRLAKDADPYAIADVMVFHSRGVKTLKCIGHVDLS